VSDLRQLSFQSLLKKKKCPRIKRRKLVATLKKKNQKIIIVTRLIPWMFTGKSCVWIASLGAGKSRRQINDWLSQRVKKRSVKMFASRLTGLGGYFAQATAFRNVCKWVDKIPAGDMIVFMCESANPEKQMNAWSKWISKHDKGLTCAMNMELKSFYIYKPRSLE
jgi:hypothetical protein